MMNRYLRWAVKAGVILALALLWVLLIESPAIAIKLPA